MKSTRFLLLVVVAVSVSCAAALTFLLSPDKKIVMADSTQMICSVLSTLLQDKCYAVLISDRHTSHSTIFKMDELHSPWGAGMFEVGGTGQDANVTHAHLSRVVDQARQMRRRSWCVTLLVVSDDPAFLMAFAEWSLKGRLLVWSTRLLLVTRMPTGDIENVLASHWTFSMMNTMALNIDPPLHTKGCSLFVHLPYGPGGAQVVKIASWTPSRGLHYTTPLTPFPDKYLSFHGGTVDIAMLTYEPYWKITMTGNTTTYSGIDYNLWITICQALNFTFRNLPTRNWAEVEDLVEFRYILITPVVYSFLPTRHKRWDYTFFFDQNGLYFAMATPEVTPSWLSFSYPLSGQVWIGVLASTLIVCILIVKITGSKMWRSRHGQLTTGSVILETVGCLLGQGLYGRVSTSHSNHILVGTWLCFGVVIGIAYRSSLIGSLTLPRLPPSPKTVEEFARAVENITMEDYGVYYKDFFSISESPTYRALGDMIHLTGNLMGALNAAANKKKQAHLGAEVNLRLKVNQEFSRLDGTSQLYLGKESMMQLMLGWPVTHDAPIKPAMDGVLMYIVQAGLYERWKKEELAAATRDQRIKQREKLRNLQHEGGTENDGQEEKLRPLSLTHVQGPLLLLALGLSLGAVVFSVEKFLIVKSSYLL